MISSTLPTEYVKEPFFQKDEHKQPKPEVLLLDDAKENNREQYTLNQQDHRLYGEQIKLKIESDANHQLWHRVLKGIENTHKKARENDFLKSLIKGQMGCSKAYVVYLCNLYSLHLALEQAQENMMRSEKIHSFIYRELYRSQKILSDIKLWSIFNETAHLFADKDPLKDKSFTTNMEPLIQKSTLEWIKKLSEDHSNNIATVFGAMYALYGTIMSGGQAVKKGVKESFLSRLETEIENDQDEIAEKDESQEKESQEKEFSLAKRQIIKDVLDNKTTREALAEESVALFSFDPSFVISEFKSQKWHPSLNKVQEELSLKPEEVDLFEKQLIDSSNNAIKTVLDMIESLQQNLAKGFI